jgi:hypothetical protein
MKKIIIITLAIGFFNALSTEEALAKTKSHTITYPDGKQVTYRWGK